MLRNYIPYRGDGRNCEGSFSYLINRVEVNPRYYGKFIHNMSTVVYPLCDLKKIN